MRVCVSGQTLIAFVGVVVVFFVVVVVRSRCFLFPYPHPDTPAAPVCNVLHLTCFRIPTHARARQVLDASGGGQHTAVVGEAS